MYDWNWNIILEYREVFFKGALTTLWLTLLVVLFGTVLGVCIGIMKRSTFPLWNWIATVYIGLFRALPILVVLIWIFYVMPTLIGLRFSPFLAAFIALSLHLAAFVAETVRAGIAAIPKNQFESGITLGFSSSQIMYHIIFPQAIRNMLPNLMGLYITELKNSSLASIIAVNELLHLSNIAISNTFRPLEIYTAVAVVYLIIILPFLFIAGRVEKHLAKKTKDISYEHSRSE